MRINRLSNRWRFEPTYVRHQVRIRVGRIFRIARFRRRIYSLSRIRIPITIILLIRGQRYRLTVSRVTTRRLTATRSLRIFRTAGWIHERHVLHGFVLRCLLLRLHTRIVTVLLIAAVAFRTTRSGSLGLIVIRAVPSAIRHILVTSWLRPSGPAPRQRSLIVHAFLHPTHDTSGAIVVFAFRYRGQRLPTRADTGSLGSG